MLRNFRQVFKGNQTPMAFLMIVVLVGLVSYLAPSGGGSEAPDAVLMRVYGREVQRRDLSEAMQRILQDFKVRGQRPTAQMMPYVLRQSIGQLLQGRLQDELVERHHVMVTREEVMAELKTTLRRNQFVNADGTLMSTDMVEKTLHEMGTSLLQMEKGVRADLEHRKLLERLAANVAVDPAWLEREHQARDGKVTFEEVTVAPEPAAVADPGDARLAAFLKEGGARFQVPPRRIVQYVLVEPATLGKAIVPDDTQLKAIYDQRGTQFEELKVSQVVFQAPTDADVPQAMRKATECRELLAKGADFKKTADEKSEDPENKKGQGGDLGWITPGFRDKAFRDAATALKPGDLSQPVRTQSGVSIIRLEARRIPPFDQIKETLRAQVVRERFEPKAKEILGQLTKRVGDRGELGAAARNLKLEVKTSQPLLGDGSVAIDGLPGSEGIVAEAFRVKVGKVSKVQKLGERFVVWRLQEERPSAVPPLAEIRAKVLEAFRLEEARKAVLAKAREALKGGDLKALGTPVAHGQATLASLGEAGRHPGIRAALLDTPKGQLTPCLFGPDGKLWVARVQDREAAPAFTFETRRALVATLQKEVADKQFETEMNHLYLRGRMADGFSSLWGRFNGIMINEEAIKRLSEAYSESDVDLGD